MSTEDIEKIEQVMKQYNIPVRVAVSLISFYGMSIEREAERVINGAGGKESTGITPIDSVNARKLYAYCPPQNGLHVSKMIIDEMNKKLEAE